jgi:hypothetical protein
MRNLHPQLPLRKLAVAATLILALSVSGREMRVAALGPLADSPWPAYGQNALRNGRSPYIGPQSAPNLRWTFTRYNDHWGTDYRGTGVGPGNTVLLSAGMAGVYAIDATTGAMRWLFSPENSATGSETWVEFPPTVASDGNLYLSSENGKIYALNQAGGVIWSYQAVHLHTPVSISPDGSTVHFVTESGYLIALNRSSGALLWSTQLTQYGVSNAGRRLPVVYDGSGNLYFPWAGYIWSLEPDGDLRWSLFIGGTPTGPAVTPNGTLVFTKESSLVGVSMGGQKLWEYTFPSAALVWERQPAIGPMGPFTWVPRMEGSMR